MPDFWQERNLPPQPDSPEAIRRTWSGYRDALGRMNQPELTEHLASINAKLELQQRQLVTQTVSQPLSEYISKIDQLVLRPTSTDPRSAGPRDRGAPPSLPSRQLNPADLLSKQNRFAARLAARLVHASVQARARAERE